MVFSKKVKTACVLEYKQIFLLAVKTIQVYFNFDF